MGLYFYSSIYLRDVHRDGQLYFQAAVSCSCVIVRTLPIVMSHLKYNIRNWKNAVTQKTQVTVCWTYASASTCTLITSISSWNTGEMKSARRY